MMDLKITKDMDVRKASDEELLFLHRILHDWYGNGKSGWSKEDIWNLHKRTAEEFENRKIMHKPEDDLDKDIKVHTSDFIHNLPEEITLQKGTVCLVGSFVEKEDYNDIDFDVRLGEDSDDYIRRAIFTRLDKIEAPKKKHIFFEPEGAHDRFIELYDLKLVKRKEPQLEKMSFEVTSENLFARPQKPGKVFYEISEVINAMFKQGREWLVEKKWDGFHVAVEKTKDKIKIYTEEGKDITNALPTLAEDTKKLSTHDFIIDGELLFVKDGKLGTRRDLMPFVTAKEKPDDANTRLAIWDISYYDEDIKHYPLAKRKEVLHQLNFSKRITPTKSIKVNTPQLAKAAIETISKLERSEGAVVKKLDSIYTPGETSSIWMKFRKMSDIHVRVLKAIPTAAGNTWNYLFGIDLTQEELKKVNPKFVQQNKLVLAKTFNTKVKCSIGDIIDVKVQEVWRHESSSGIRYSIHKPLFESKRPDISSTSSLRDLDDIVVALGIAVKERLEELIQDYKDYANIVSQLDDAVLLDDHRIVHGWWATLLGGKVLRHKDGAEITKEEIRELHILIIKEMKKRGFEHKTPLEMAKMSGLYLVAPHGEMIWKGQKTLIVKSKKFDILDKIFYVLQGDKCYGTIRIRSVEPIDLKTFEATKDLHRITDLERKKWWSGTKLLYAYQFDLVTRYQPPASVKVPRGAQTFVKDVEINAEEKPEWEKYQILGPSDNLIRDFPRTLQADFKYVMEKKLHPQFVIHHHERGESLHTDIRLQIPHKKYLQGFTIANPANVTQEDRIDNTAKNVLIVEIKPPQPEMWLRLEGRSEKGEPGSTRHKAGIFTIVGKGSYSIWYVDDHKIGIEFYCDKGRVKLVEGRLRKEPDELKQLKGKFSITINHIKPERWVGYLSHLKSAKLCERGSKAYVILEQDWDTVYIRRLKSFDGINIIYNVMAEGTKAKIGALQFDKRLWNSQRIKMFLKKYGRQVLNFEANPKFQSVLSCPHVQGILKELLQTKRESGLEKINLESSIVVELSQEFKIPYKINFVALKPGKFNGVYYSEEELKKAAETLKTKDLTIDHGKSVRDVVGKVLDAWWDEKLKQIEGTAEILDEEVAKKVRQGLITGVSVEVYVNYYESEFGLSAKNTEFRALSLVRNPACKTCLIFPEKSG